jgi:hypothetical protein
VLVATEPYKSTQVLPTDIPALKANVIEATRADALYYAKHLHMNWLEVNAPTTTTTTTTYGYPTTTYGYSTTTTTYTYPATTTTGAG